MNIYFLDETDTTIQVIINGFAYSLPTLDIKELMQGCKCTKEEAIDIWLTDHDYIVNEEQEKLNKSAKNARIADVRDKKRTKTSKKERKTSVSAEKQQLFSEIWSDLEDVYRNSVKVLKENKLLEVKINGKTFKIDVIEQRPSKN